MCGYKKERRWMFSPGDFVFFSLSTSRFKNLPFLVLEKRFLSRFVFASCVVVVVRRRHFRAFLVGRPSPKKSTRFVVLSVSSHAPLESCLREHLLTVESARTGA